MSPRVVQRKAGRPSGEAGGLQAEYTETMTVSPQAPKANPDVEPPEPDDPMAPPHELDPDRQPEDPDESPETNPQPDADPPLEER